MNSRTSMADVLPIQLMLRLISSYAAHSYTVSYYHSILVRTFAYGYVHAYDTAESMKYILASAIMR